MNLFDKVLKVIDSCKTIGQLIVAENYSSLASKELSENFLYLAGAEKWGLDPESEWRYYFKSIILDKMRDIDGKKM